MHPPVGGLVPDSRDNQNQPSSGSVGQQCEQREDGLDARFVQYIEQNARWKMFNILHILLGVKMFDILHKRFERNVQYIEQKRRGMMMTEMDSSEGTAMNFEEASSKALAFREDRDWAQYHNPKDLAISIGVEAAELLEVFQWSGADLEVAQKADKAREELADIVIYCVYLADRLGINLADAISDKIDKNEEKYPIEKSRGSAKKYTEL